MERSPIERTRPARWWRWYKTTETGRCVPDPRPITEKKSKAASIFSRFAHASALRRRFVGRPIFALSLPFLRPKKTLACLFPAFLWQNQERGQRFMINGLPFASRVARLRGLAGVVPSVFLQLQRCRPPLLCHRAPGTIAFHGP